MKKYEVYKKGNYYYIKTLKKSFKKKKLRYIRNYDFDKSGLHFAKYINMFNIFLMIIASFINDITYKSIIFTIIGIVYIFIIIIFFITIDYWYKTKSTSLYTIKEKILILNQKEEIQKEELVTIFDNYGNEIDKSELEKIKKQRRRKNIFKKVLNEFK